MSKRNSDKKQSSPAATETGNAADCRPGGDPPSPNVVEPDNVPGLQSGPASSSKPPENAHETNVKPELNALDGFGTHDPLPTERMETDGKAAESRPCHPAEEAAANVIKALAIAQAALSDLHRASPSTLCHECRDTLARVRTRIRQQYPVPIAGSPQKGG